MIANGYTVDLYCDKGDDCKESDHFKTQHGIGAAQYTGETYAQCAKKAKRDGWYLSRDRQRAICPACLKKEPK